MLMMTMSQWDAYASLCVYDPIQGISTNQKGLAKAYLKKAEQLEIALEALKHITSPMTVFKVEAAFKALDEINKLEPKSSSK